MTAFDMITFRQDLELAVSSGLIKFVRIQDNELIELEVTSILQHKNNDILVGLVLEGDRG